MAPALLGLEGALALDEEDGVPPPHGLLAPPREHLSGLAPTSYEQASSVPARPGAAHPGSRRRAPQPAHSPPADPLSVTQLASWQEGGIRVPQLIEGLEGPGLIDDQAPDHHLEGLGPAARLRRRFHWPPPPQAPPLTPLLTASIDAVPLAGPPASAFRRAAMITAREATVSGLVQLATPIRREAFAAMLAGHPNKPLVDSVLRGLHQGFWPCHSGVPTPPLPARERDRASRLSPEHRQLIEEQVDKEVARG